MNRFLNKSSNPCGDANKVGGGVSTELASPWGCGSIGRLGSSAKGG